MAATQSATARAGERFAQKKWSAGLLASAWCLPMVVLMGWVATSWGVWGVLPAKGLVLGVPAAILLGRVIIWGWATAYFLGEQPAVIWFIAGWLGDLMLLATNGVEVRGHGLFVLVEVVSVIVCVIPGQYFARWTREGKNLAARNAMHVVFHAGLILGVWPLLVTELFGGDWRAMGERSSAVNKIYLQLLLVPAVFLMTAMQEFYVRGEGTPMPDDPPRKLVTSGIYGYVANPMQIGKFGMLAGWGLFWRSPWIIGVGCAGLVYSLTVARWREDRDMSARYGEAWRKYRAEVRKWVPRWRPWFAEEDKERAIYLDLECGPCAQMGRWFAKQQPVGLRICPLEEHPGGVPARITYRFGNDGREENGMAAVGRALEHVHLGWAFCGWMLRLPGICQMAQMIADAISPEREIKCAGKRIAV